MVTINSHFIGNFKDGDNICYNLEVLTALYTSLEKAEAENKKYLYKPIIVFIVAIIEASMDDLFYKIRRNTVEGVPNLSRDTILQVRTNLNSYRKFKSQIKFARRNDFFDAGDTNLYSAIDFLRELRNRMHIQNNYRHHPLNEDNAFTLDMVRKSEKVCEHILAKMSEKFPRSVFARGYVADFILPWNSHFTVADV